MSCRGCGLLSALGGVAARGWKRGVQRAREYSPLPESSMWEVHRLSDGSPAQLGASVSTRVTDASGKLLYYADLRR